MFRRHTCFAEDYPKAIASGRGTGRFTEYRPFLEVQDVPSVALRYKVPLLSTQRIHHLLSHGEFQALLLFDWMDTVIEICEQYPLDPAITKGICSGLGLRHPSFAGRPTVMTSDFLVTFDDGFTCERKAYQIKATKQDAQSSRTAEKLEIEKEYWLRKGKQWQLLVSEDFNAILTANLEMLHQLRNTPFSSAELEEAAEIWCQMADEADPLCGLAELSMYSATVGCRELSGFQVALLLLGRKLLRAPIELACLNGIKIGDVTESWNQCEVMRCQGEA